MDILTDLLDQAEAFASDKGLSVKTVSGKLFGNGERIAQYRSGQISPSMRTLEQARQRLDDLKAGRKPEVA